MMRAHGQPFFAAFLQKRSLPFLLVLALTACGDDTPPVTQTFAPLQYSYLPKLRLNVGAIDIQDHSLPVGPQDVAASSPAVPAQALQQMARDRLFAAGTQGRANFVIDQASIVREPSGALDGRLGVHLDLMADGGARSGFAEAQVSRQYVPGSDTDVGPQALYNLTRQMMDAMHVEREFQVRRTLPNWLVSAGGTPAPVVAQPLDVPGAPAVPPPPALPPAAADETPVPDQDGYVDPAAPPPPVQMSPPPGFLQAPQQ